MSTSTDALTTTGFAGSQQLDLVESGAKIGLGLEPSLIEKPLEGLLTKQLARAVRSLGLRTVRDLLYHLPHRHESRGGVRAIESLKVGEDAAIAVSVTAVSKRQAWRKRKLTVVEAKVADETGTVKAVWFNQPWVADRISEGARIVLHGRCGGRGRFTVSEYRFSGSDFSAGGGVNELAGTVSVYPAGEGVSPAKLRTAIRVVAGYERHVIEPLPARLRAAEGLPDLPTALKAMHFPSDLKEAEEGRRRLAFDELFLLALALVNRRLSRDTVGAPALAREEGETVRQWMAKTLPFQLTQDQRRATEIVSADLASDVPMQRLLMGEVGSGKTVVALYTMLRALEEGHQAALMAPTETLAEQHFATIQSLTGGMFLQASLLTGSTPQARRRRIIAGLASGQIKLVVGTHALIEPSVRFDSLAVAVVDEQHRFGVEQRTELDRKGPNGLAPHVLHMTATPIPRTLALAAYGDLDVTVLRELPKGRLPVETYVAESERERARAYERIREELDAGRQAFVVCPLVEHSELLQARAATVEFERLSNEVFPEYEVMLMHGQMRPAEKQQAMTAFADGKAQVLVATSVIEVGIDVPNATVMLVENAERYGISQLHQLRGRVGRGRHRSLCLLFGPKGSPRLRALADNSDGFKLAEIDLELRGEGEIVGKRQSGLAQFKVARLPADTELLERANSWAKAILAEDPALSAPEHVLLADALKATYGDEAYEPIPA